MNNNEIVIAAAGSRKTTFIVEEALNIKEEKIVILTYTIENQRQIEKYLIEKNCIIPENITVCSWFSFLLSDGARPYQNYLYDKKRIQTICFVEGKSTKYVKKENVEKYFFTMDGRIYTDKIAEFACMCNDISDGLVISRIESIYKHVFIDEVQDLAGYDLDFLELLIKAETKVTIVGDSRQATYFTNCSPKNKKYKGSSIIELFKDWERKGLVSITHKNECFRCNQKICDFADGLYPEMPKTKSVMTMKTGHDGIYKIDENRIKEYIEEYSPVILRDTKRTNTFGYRAINFGLSKGQTYKRILVFPNTPIKKYLENAKLEELKPTTKARFYVAITRAMYSVCFVYNKRTTFMLSPFVKQFYSTFKVEPSIIKKVMQQLLPSQS